MGVADAVELVIDGGKVAPLVPRIVEDHRLHLLERGRAELPVERHRAVAVHLDRRPETRADHADFVGLLDDADAGDLRVHVGRDNHVIKVPVPVRIEIVRKLLISFGPAKEVRPEELADGHAIGLAPFERGRHTGDLGLCTAHEVSR